MLYTNRMSMNMRHVDDNGSRPARMGESKQKSARGIAKRGIRVVASNGNLRPQTSLSSDIGFVRTAFRVASAELLNPPLTSYDWT